MVYGCVNSMDTTPMTTTCTGPHHRLHPADTTPTTRLGDRGIEHHVHALKRLESELHADIDAKRLGIVGEHYAATWLECQGWHVLERNWRTRYGELDIIMLDPGNAVVFVEVKTRRSMRQGVPQEAVTSAKQANLRHAALQWLGTVDTGIARNGLRFDVLAITVGKRDTAVRHIKEAF